MRSGQLKPSTWARAKHWRERYRIWIPDVVVVEFGGGGVKALGNFEDGATAPCIKQ